MIESRRRSRGGRPAAGPAVEAAKGLQMAQAAKLLDYKKDVDEKSVDHHHAPLA